MRNRRAFTLVEVLIAIVILGILSALAVPRVADSRERAYIAVMRMDLRNLATAQEGYYAEYFGYTADLAQLGNFLFSPGVTLQGPIAASPTGWSATARHAGTSATCSVGVGTGVLPGYSDGQVHCP